MKISCPRCKEWMREEDAKQHTLESCKSAAKGFTYLKHNLRPFPPTHSLPKWMGPCAEDMTRVAYEGEPREERPMLIVPEMQFWVPRWVDVIVELWVGSIYMLGPQAMAQRDRVLLALFNEGPNAVRSKKVVDAYAEDLRAVRDLIAPLVQGPLPKLLSEIDGRGY